MKTVKTISLSFTLLALVMAGLSPSNAAAEYKFGVIGIETGPYASVGASNIGGVYLLADIFNKQGGINGEQITLLKEEYAGDEAKALVIAKRMISDEKVIGIMGATSTAGSMAISRVTEESKIPHVQWAPRPEGAPLLPWTFQTSPAGISDSEAMVRFATEKLKAKKFAIMHDTNSYGTTGAESTAQVLKNLNIPLVTVEKYNRDDRDVTAPLLKIKNSGAEVIIVWGSVNVPPIIAKQMKSLQIKIPYIGSIGVMNQKFLELAGEAANGVYFTSALSYGNPVPGQAQFFKVFESLNKSPDLYYALGWDSMLLFAEAIKQSKSKNPAQIRDAIENLKNLEGVVGTYNMSPTDHVGTTYKDIKIIQVVDGKWVAVKN
jgi:branched-chain amino acid transport system substrate-binding protein